MNDGAVCGSVRESALADNEQISPAALAASMEQDKAPIGFLLEWWTVFWRVRCPGDGSFNHLEQP